MKTYTSTEQIPQRPAFPNKAIMTVVLLNILAFVTSIHLSQPPPESLRDNRLKMEKNSGKNEKHANPKARESAKQQYEKPNRSYNNGIKNPIKRLRKKNT